MSKLLDCINSDFDLSRDDYSNMIVKYDIEVDGYSYPLSINNVPIYIDAERFNIFSDHIHKELYTTIKSQLKNEYSVTRFSDKFLKDSRLTTILNVNEYYGIQDPVVPDIINMTDMYTNEPIRVHYNKNEIDMSDLEAYNEIQELVNGRRYEEYVVEDIF